MDWYSWLSKTNIEPSIVYKYSLSFADNELEEDDVAYFNHEFLQSLGISIAKHRLEIIKLSRNYHRVKPTVKKLLVAIKKCLKTLVNGLGSVNNHHDSALVVVQTQSFIPIRDRDKKLLVAKQGRLMITNGSYSSSPFVVSSSGRSKVNSFSSPLVYNHKSIKVEEDYDHDDGYWSSSNGAEEIKWDTLFRDLKPN